MELQLYDLSTEERYVFINKISTKLGQVHYYIGNNFSVQEIFNKDEIQNISCVICDLPYNIFLKDLFLIKHNFFRLIFHNVYHLNFLPY